MEQDKFKFKRIFTIGSILMFSSAIYPILMLEQNGSFDVLNSMHIRFCFIIIYLISFIYLLPKLDILMKMLRDNLVLIIFLSFVLFSTAWSTNSLESLIGLLGLTGTTCFALFLTIYYDRSELTSVFLISFWIMVISSLIFSIIFSSFAYHSDIHHDGVLRGAFTHKNVLGRTVALGLIVLIIKMVNDKKIFLSQVLLFILSIFLLISSDSMSSLVITIVVILLGYYLSLKINSKLYLSLTCFFITVVLILIIFLISNWEYIMVSLGRDPTLTGRTVLWGFLLDLIHEKPISGYGYQAFWLGEEGKYSNAINNFFNWTFPHGHNGYLDLLLQIGLIGTLIYIIMYIITLKRELKILNSAYINKYSYLNILLFILFINITETNMIEPNSIFWILFVYILLSGNLDFGKEVKKEL
ncbi:O-antigen ligase family protein [Alkalicoccobacillus gibsonii]|uniref:O-antigen ligase family protein n=1 Tax=Alkalicoccobacillus gibsonii TaxID=79881 RepID=A0ABU9VM06_9BACI